MDDEVDNAKAARFAWRVTPPDPTQEQLEATRDVALQADRAWARPHEEQPHALRALLPRMQEAGLLGARLPARATIRLLQLFVRHWSALDGEERRSVHGLACAPVDCPELADLAVDVAVYANYTVQTHLYIQLDGEDLDLPGLADRLGAVLASASTASSRELATQ